MLKRFLFVCMILALTFTLVVPMAAVQAQPGNVVPMAPLNPRFRVIIAANLPTAVDVWLDGAITTESGLYAVQPLNYSGSIVISAGASHTINLYEKGTKTAVGSPKTFTSDPATHTSFVLLPDFTWMTLPITTIQTQSSQAKARLVNLSPNNNPVSLAVNGTVPTGLKDVAYKASTAYIDFPMGWPELTLPGTNAMPFSRLIEADHIYSVLVFWDANRTPAAPKILLSTESDFSPPRVIGTARAVHTHCEIEPLMKGVD